jgi:hypothetical protein
MMIIRTSNSKIISLIFLFSLVQISFSSQANQAVADSLQLLLQQENMGLEQKIKTLNELYKLERSENIHDAYTYIFESIELAKDFEDRSLFAQTSFLYAEILSLQG